MQSDSIMLQEAYEAPQVVARQLASNVEILKRLAGRFSRLRPRFIATSARGSSDNAATYAKYLLETRLGLPVSSAAPSIGAIYRAPVDLKDSVMLCISQSGASFDLVENARWAKKRGALVISLLNTPDSPLGNASDVIVPLMAGKENSIAATKSHIASLSAILQMAAHVGRDKELLGLLDALPEQLERARLLDWSNATATLKACNDLYVVGRGLGLGAAQEVALKLKEACGLHAEAFSGAEMMHGPVALVRKHYPFLLFTQNDETRPGIEKLARSLRAMGASVFAAGLSNTAARRAGPEFCLPVVSGIHPVVAPLTWVQTYYGLAHLVARLRGMEPDHPPHLMKATQTT